MRERSRAPHRPGSRALHRPGSRSRRLTAVAVPATAAAGTSVPAMTGGTSSARPTDGNLVCGMVPRRQPVRASGTWDRSGAHAAMQPG
ncbi:hypothetical protein QBC98_003834 [Kitasatospora acidiphila]